MSAHIPCIGAEQDIYIVPENDFGAFTNCDCPDCREARLADPDRIRYSAHEMADTWTNGYFQGNEAVVRRLIRVLADWLQTDELDPGPRQDGS